MPYININSPRGFQSFDVTEEFIKENSCEIVSMVGGASESGMLSLDDGYGNLVVYGAEVLRQSVITFGGRKK
jgi:hypothetical protein